MILKNDWVIVYEKAIREDGSLLFPERLSKEFLESARRTMGSYLFANQYQNEIIPEGKQTFKKEWITYYEELPPTVNTFCFIDPAISEADTADYTGIVVVSVDVRKNWYVRSARRMRLNPTEIMETCFRLARQFKPMMIGIEDVAFQRVLVHFTVEEMKKRGEYIPIRGIKIGTEKTKEQRILSLVGRFEYQNLFLAPGLLDLETELAKFPRGSHDDLCFPAGTKILTSSGNKKVESIKPGDLVFTPVGFDVVARTGIRSSTVIRNMGLCATPGHKVFTWNGLKRLDALSRTDLLSKLSCKELIRWTALKQFISMELNLREWVGRESITYLNTQKTKTGELKRLDFTSLFLNFIQRKKFLKAFIFTIRTAIHSTMSIVIWNALRLRSILSLLEETTNSLKEILIGQDYLQKNGMQAKREESGTENTQSKPGSKLKELLKIVSSVIGSTKHRSKTLGFAVSYAPEEVGAKDVYSIETSRHRFYYADNILVSNCDALSSIQEIVVYPEPKRRRDEPPHPHSPGYESWYIEQLTKRGNATDDY